MTVKPLGILAYGSLISDPGAELAPLIVERKETRTPFGVEYGRLSSTRGGAPTVVRHPKGAPVDARVLVLSEAVTLDDAKDMLWRREKGIVGSGKRRTPSSTVLVKEHPSLCGCRLVIFTDFSDEPIADPQPVDLARAAIASVRSAKPGKDGISYLAALMKQGIVTLLTNAYCAEVLQQTATTSLADALAVARSDGVIDGKSG